MLWNVLLSLQIWFWNRNLKSVWIDKFQIWNCAVHLLESIGSAGAFEEPFEELFDELFDELEIVERGDAPRPSCILLPMFLRRLSRSPIFWQTFRKGSSRLPKLNFATNESLNISWRYPWDLHTSKSFGIRFTFLCISQNSLGTQKIIKFSSWILMMADVKLMFAYFVAILVICWCRLLGISQIFRRSLLYLKQIFRNITKFTAKRWDKIEGRIQLKNMKLGQNEDVTQKYIRTWNENQLSSLLDEAEVLLEAAELVSPILDQIDFTSPFRLHHTSAWSSILPKYVGLAWKDVGTTAATLNNMPRTFWNYCRHPEEDQTDILWDYCRHRAQHKRKDMENYCIL